MHLLPVAVAIVAVGLWALVLLVAVVSTRSRQPVAGPAVMDLGPEPPAVVNLLANRWSLNEDAAEATLLDLAARRFVELRQPGNDPMETTVHLTGRLPAGEQLRPYEKQVLDRIAALATDGMVPVAALAFRDENQAKGWTRRLHAAVIVEARRLGLSRRRFGAKVTMMRVIAAGIGGFGIFVGLYGSVIRHRDSDTGSLLMAVLIGFFSVLLLFQVSERFNGERETAAGLEVAGRWLGVRDWLRNHDQFGTLPPASVMVWDRYLGYGAALGVTRVASMVLDLGMGSRTLLWSAYGGSWHRVKVRYPRFWPIYGKPADAIARWTIVRIGVGLAVLAAGRYLLGFLPGPAAAAGGVALLCWGCYVGVRAVRDRATVEVTGAVLRKELWRSQKQSDRKPAVPWLHYLVVSDGGDDTVVAWGLPSERIRECAVGDIVTIQAHTWTRRIVGLRVQRRTDRQEPVAPVVRQDTQSYVRELLLADTREVFPERDVAALLGLPVVRQGTIGKYTYRAVASGAVMARVVTVTDADAELIWRREKGANARTYPGGFVNGSTAYARHDAFVTMLTLTGAGLPRAPYLPWLLEQEAARS